MTATARAEHGQFDKGDVNPAEEAYLFTPPGFEHEGQPAVASGPSAARLHVTILDAATGKPALCRVNVVGADGNYYQPQDNPLIENSLTGKWPDTLAGNRPGKAPIRYFGRFFYTAGDFNVDVPAGAARIEVWKGFEYRPEVLTTNIAAGAARSLRMAIARRAPMAARGWYSGDSHLHFIRASEADDRRIFDLLEAEDIRFGTILCYNDNTSLYGGVMPELATPQLHGLGQKSIRRRGDYQILSAQEYRNGVLGHLNLYLRDSLVLDGQKLDPNVGPMFGTISTETREHGGYAFHAHGGYALEIWADLVHGATNGVELLQFGIYRGIGLDGWYHVLNAGFRFPGVGACDYPACRKLGDARTYVHLSGLPTFKNWLAGAAGGRSFMTTGPLLLLDVDSRRPGDTITTRDATPRTLLAHLQVSTETAPVTDVQLIVNGRVVEELKVKVRPGESQRVDLTKSLRVTEPSWIAARAFSKSPSGNADAESHTNPVYVHLGGQTPYHQEDADWLAERLDEQIADHQARNVAEKSVPIEYFRAAKEKLLAIGKQRAPETATAKATPSEPAKPAEKTKIAATSVIPQSDAELAEILKPVPAKTPAEALRSFETQNGFRMELVAAEPEVADPVAACFDENGGMFVAEMIDYPYRPKEGETPLGQVRYLEDANGDGKYEKSWVFADGIVWPTGVVCWKGGVFVAAAPDIWYLKDTDGDHRADVREKIYTGFGDRNQQGGVNNLNWGIDHTIYGSGSSNGGSIRPAGKPDAPAILLSNCDFRFDPVSGRIETVSGSEQFGNAFDDWFNRFLCNQAKPGYHVVLPQHYLARNPNLAVPTALKDLAPGVTPIFRISPVEKWREIRSSRRLAVGERSARSSGLSHDVMDATAGLTIYRGDAYPPEYRGNLFVGCSQNNLVHRRQLTPDGPTFSSERVDDKTEFVRSTDTWFRPVNCVNAPDGTLYVLDMSREIIESVHIANDVVAHLDLKNGRDKGRVYRLAPPGFKLRPQPQLGKATNEELVAALEHPGGWWRDTASRLIFERQDRSLAPLLRARLAAAKSDVGRMHILWALDGLNALEEQDLAAALADPSPGVREHGVRLAEPRLTRWPALFETILALAADPQPRVRFQVAFTLGESTDPRAVAALATIAARDAGETWTRTAVLSSCGQQPDRLAEALLKDSVFTAQSAAGAWLEQLATIVGARKQDAEIGRLLDAAAALPEDSPLASAIVLGLGAGLQRSSSTLEAARPAASAAAGEMLARLFADAARQASDTEATGDQRSRAIRLLGYVGGRPAIKTLADLLDPRQNESLQIAAIRALGRFSEPDVAARLIGVWRGSMPKVQEEIITTLGSREPWVGALLDACDRGELTAAQVPRATRTALLAHQDSALRAHAEKLFGGKNSPRAEVVAGYQAALEVAGDAVRGDQVYQRECVACHKLGERGSQVGPNLALIRNRTPRALLEAILDPNREVQPNYVSYVIVDDAGRSTTGMILAETANSITLARDKGVTETIQKQNVEQMRSSGLSLMPEGLEKTIDVQGLADLLAFLRQVQYDIGTLPDFVAPAEQ